jgi:hypothetical protein
VPERFSATFDVSARGLTIGEAQWVLAPEEDGRYRLRSVTRPTGMFGLVLSGERREQSLWAYVAGRPRPLAYDYERVGRKARQDHIEFDWTRRVAVSTSAGKRWELPLAADTLDGLSYLLALMQDLAKPDASLRYAFAERGKVKTYALLREGRETVTTGLGAMETLRLSRTDEKGRRTRLWCAPALAHLPVQIEHAESDGDPITLLLRAAEGLGPAAQTGRADPATR